MYAWLWRHLPGPRPIRLLICVGFIALAVVALFLWIFPWGTDAFNIDRDVTVS